MFREGLSIQTASSTNPKNKAISSTLEPCGSSRIGGDTGNRVGEKDVVKANANVKGRILARLSIYQIATVSSA